MFMPRTFNRSRRRLLRSGSIYKNPDIGRLDIAAGPDQPRDSRKAYPHKAECGIGVRALIS